MKRQIFFMVRGEPAPQGSKNMMRNYRTGQMIMMESCKKLAPWRKAVTEAAELAAGASWLPIAGPVRLEVIFTVPRPRSHWRTGKHAHLLTLAAPLMPISHAAGDLSKLVRAAEDALTDARIWADDALVVETWAVKVYPDQQYPGASEVPGAWISVTTIELPEVQLGQPRTDGKAVA